MKIIKDIIAIMVMIGMVFWYAQPVKAGIFTTPRFQVDTGGTLMTSLVMYYKLDESSDGSGAVTRYDASTNTEDLTDNNTTPSETGILGNASSHLIANSEYLSRGDSTANSLDGTNWSICAWFKPTALTVANLGIVAKDTSNSDGGSEYQLLTGGDLRGGSPYIQTRHTGGWSSTTSTFGNFTAGTWYFICGWWDGTTLSISVNNGTANTSTPAALISSTSDLRIGSDERSGAGGMLDGAVDEVGIWKKVLSSTEFTDLYNGGAGNTVIETVAGGATKQSEIFY